MSKYLKLFQTHSEYETYINDNPSLPNVSICKDDLLVHYNPYSEPAQPNDEIWYTTVNGDAVRVIAESGDYGTYMGPTLVSNTAPKDNNGKGIIKFSEAITKLGFIDTEFSQYYPIIAPDSEETLLLSFSLPSSLYYLGYGSIWYCSTMTSITIPDTVTELWEFPDYEEINANAACPFLEARIYDSDSGLATGGVEKYITSKGEFTWNGTSPNDYCQVTLGNGNEYKIVDIIGV